MQRPEASRLALDEIELVKPVEEPVDIRLGGMVGDVELVDERTGEVLPGGALRQPAPENRTGDVRRHVDGAPDVQRHDFALHVPPIDPGSQA